MADDGFETYYAEKLWEMIPAVYRHQDGLGANAGVLRAMVEVLANQAAILRRSHDRLWEDQFIELCDDWAVPYLGDLLATRLVSALNPRGRRVDVAKTIYYRRRAGTPAVLEQLISDITGWEGTVVEEFRRLGRAHHRLDPLPGPRAGRFTNTSPGGWADLRRPRGAARAHGPFGEYHHTPDFRRHRGTEGRYNIPKVAFHLYRLPAWEVEGVTPYPVDADQGRYTFDPSGREIRLFMPASRPQDPRAPDRGGHWERWRAAREWELPAPMDCRVLNHAEYRIDGAGIRSQGAELSRLRGRHFVDETALRRALKTLPSSGVFLANLVPLKSAALVEDCGKAHLLFRAVRVESNGELLPEVQTMGLNARQRERRALARTAAADLSSWTTTAPEDLLVDPERGRFLLQEQPSGDSLAVTYHYGFYGEIGAGGYHRSTAAQRKSDQSPQGGGPLRAAQILRAAKSPWVVEITDSATYRPEGEIGLEKVGKRNDRRELVLQAADRQRPYLQLPDAGDDRNDWVFQGTRNPEPILVLDGLWIGARQAGSLTLKGDFERVELRHVTLDPGGEDAGGDSLPALELRAGADMDLLKIESAITGPIQVTENVKTLVIRDAIVQSIRASDTDVILERVTVFGELDARRLWATEALLTGTARVEDIQSGCFRFGARPAASRLPSPYQSHELDDTGHLFVSRRFGDPGYAQLSLAAPEFLRRGAENGSEIGAFSELLNPIKMDSLRAKVEEFLPFGLIPIYIPET